MRWPWKRAAEPYETLIVPPTYRFTGCDEALRARTQARREAARRIRERAHKVESGTPLGDVLKVVQQRSA